MENNYAYWYDLCFRGADNDAAYIRNFCDSCGEGTILEPGSGTGRVASYVKSDRIKYLELSGEMIEVFLRNHPGKKDALIQGSADSLPFPDGSLAGIYVPFNGIAELVPVAFTLKEFHRALKADGKLLICAANPDLPVLRAGTGVVEDGGAERPFQFDGRSFKTPFGKHSWQTRFSIRTEDGDFSYFVDQYLIRRQRLEELCAAAGFKVDSVHGDYDGAPWTPVSPWTLLTLSKSGPDGGAAPSEQVKKLTATYDTVAPGYDGFAEKGQYAVPKWLAAKLREIRLVRPVILDLGCANGNLGRLAADRFGRCTLAGLDISPAMIAELRKRGLYKNSMVWDLNKGLPFIEAELFDLAFAFGVLEFVKDPGVVLDGLAEVLKPTGSLLCAFEVFDEKAGGEKAVTDPRIGFPRFRYTEEDVKGLLRARKLALVSCERLTAYKSPSTGAEVDYLLVHAKRDKSLA